MYRWSPSCARSPCTFDPTSRGHCIVHHLSILVLHYQPTMSLLMLMLMLMLKTYVPITQPPCASKVSLFSGKAEVSSWRGFWRRLASNSSSLSPERRQLSHSTPVLGRGEKSLFFKSMATSRDRRSKLRSQADFAYGLLRFAAFKQKSCILVSD